MNKFKHRDSASKEPYHYTMSGLNDIYLVSGYSFEETDYGRGVVIQDLDELHKSIGRYLACCKKTLNGSEVRFLRHEMDLTQAELGRLLRVTDQTVARWEKGEVQIPGPEELLVRGFYVGHSKRNLDLAKLSASIEAIEGTSNEKLLFSVDGDGWQAIAA
jgi:putative transcriptional regulator